MTTHLLHCAACGSSNLRRSKRQSFAEGLSMMLGTYPFRCLDCGTRRSVSVWLISKMGLAKCPKCLSLHLLVWPEKHFRLSGMQNLLITFGAHRYRCFACRHHFLSFRRRQSGERDLHDQPRRAAAVAD